jgi:hypothetical protein
MASSRSFEAFGTYPTARAAITASTATATSTATARCSALIAVLSILSLCTCSGTVGLVGVLLRLARKLNGDLAVKDLFAGELSDGTLRLAGGRKVNEGVAYRAFGARVLWDRGGFTEGQSVSNCKFTRSCCSYEIWGARSMVKGNTVGR